MKTLTFRFDIDTHKCIREGVSNLLDVAEKENVRFSFFLNTGRAISVVESIKNLFVNKQTEENIEMMGALNKLGIIDYLYAAVINPNLIDYQNQIRRLAMSTSEMGIHGGRNHAVWHKCAMDWTEEQIRQEIDFAINNIRSIVEDYSPQGFASPGWTSPLYLPQVLKECGFTYYADLRCKGRNEVTDVSGVLPCIGVNMLGEPGGVAFFESCRVKGLDDLEIINKISRAVNKHDNVVLYDHPYYSGIHEIEMIKRIIDFCKQKEIKIVTLGELL